MSTDIEQTERELRIYRPRGASIPSLPAEFVWPRYEGRCVGNLGATAARLLGAELPGALPPLAEDVLGDLVEGAKRVVLLVMDGLGWIQLRRAMAQHEDLVFHRLAERGRLVPLTTTFLSTTNSVLSTIWTGHPPVEHGLLAYELYLREWMMAVEAIGFSSPFEPFSNTLLRWGYEPEQFLPVPSVAQILGEQGVTSVAVIAKQFTTTPLSRMHYRGANEIRAHSYTSDLWVALRQALAYHGGERDERLLLAGYWAAVDSLAHKHGPQDETGEAEVWTMAQLMEALFLDRLEARDRDGTLLLLTADHGLITTPPTSTVVLGDHPELWDMLWMPPVGEGRVPFFYVRNGMEVDARAYLEASCGEHFTFLSREEVLGSGLLGPGEPYAEVPFRLGDLVGIAKGDSSFARTEEDAKRLVGRHGGLAPEEMLVPLLAVRLEDV
ncbi:MAG: alkaline phosphatase family protein [Anaerolineae bacterium]